MRLLLGLVIALVLTLIPNAPVAAQSSPSWQNILIPGVSDATVLPGNLPNYGYNSVVVDPGAPGTVYVGTNYQGVYKSTDDGTTWTKIDTGAGSASLDAGRQWTMSIDQSNRTLWTASGTVGGVYKSTDGGVSWTNTLTSTSPVDGQAAGSRLCNLDVYAIVTDPFAANHVLATFHGPWCNNANSGIIESLDGGSTWVSHMPGAGGYAGSAVGFGNDSNTWLFGAQETSTGVLITHNAGSTWASVTPTPINHGATQAFYRSTAGTLVVVAGNASPGPNILRSTDNGATWTDISAGLPYAYYDAIVSDGTTLYTASGYPSQGSNGNGTVVAKSLAGNDAWATYNSPQTFTEGGPNHWSNGPVMGAYDAINHALFATNWQGGLWRLQIAPPPPTPTPTPSPTPCGSCPTSTPTPTATATPTPSTSASFVGQDATTSGSWMGVYGSQGYWIATVASGLPAFAVASTTGQSYVWNASTTDTRALQVPGSSSRLASTWFSFSSFVIDLNLTDGLHHSISLYALDWDSTSRAETLAVLDANTGGVLDTRSASGFHSGLYTTWNISGHVQFKVTPTAGANGVISAVFVDAAR